MKKIRLIFVFLFLISFLKVSVASHMMASDIGWKYLGNDDYLFTINIYQDCNGVAASSFIATFKDALTGTSLNTYTFANYTIKDVTPVCPGTCTRCQSTSCSFPYGISQYTYTGIVKLSSTTVCDIIVGFESCCRTGSITTGAGNANFYSEAKLNRCQGLQNNSPVLPALPIDIRCVGQDVAKNIGGYDIDTLGSKSPDSLVYSFGQPLQAAYSIISYSGSYTYDKPIYFWGFPNSNLPFPRGIHLDPMSGDLQYRPMKAEVTTFVVKVEEYRNKVKISEIRREMILIVVTCPSNNPPVITTPNNVRSKTVCAGDSVVFDFSTSDANSSDSLKISWNKAIPNAVWTDSNGVSRQPKARLVWHPTSSHASSLPYTFTVTVKDNACPVSASFTLAYQITVKAPQPPIVPQVTVTDLGCGKFHFRVRLNNGFPTNYRWTGSDGFWSVDSSFYRTFSQAGIYPFNLRIDDNYCSPYYYYDTIRIPNLFYSNMPATYEICQTDSIRIQPVVFNNTGKVNYLWSTGDTTSYLDVTNQMNDNTVYLTISDQSGCSFLDSTVIKVHNLSVYLGKDTATCYSQVRLNLVKSSDYQPTTQSWYKLGQTGVLTTGSYYYVSQSGYYWCELIDPKGCKAMDTVKVTIDPYPVFNLGTDQHICYKSLVTLSAGGGIKYLWSTGDTTSVIRLLVDTNVKIKVTSTNSCNCSTSDSINIFVLPKPVADFEADSTYGNVPFSVYFTTKSHVSSGFILNYSWNFGDGGISVSANTTHQYTQGGDFDVSLLVNSDQFCKDTLLKKKYIRVVNAINEAENYGILLYPNPVDDYFIINNSSNNFRIVEYQLFNSIGKLITQNNHPDQTIQFARSNLSPGIYLIKISLDNSKEVITRLVFR